VTAELERVGLLADPARVAVLRRSVGILGGLLIALGVVRIVAGALANRPVAFLVIIVLAVSFATSRLLRHTPYATAAGRDLLRRLRENRRGRAHAAESAMNMALFGAGAIWLADPGTASAIGVPRYAPGGYDGGGAGGGCGGGGCGGGGCGG
jgi:uncharacterized protein (TIGR04222 family)